MSLPRLRALLSLGLIGCMTLSLVPLGCHPVKLKHSPAPSGSPHIPEATAARLRECVEELEGEISHGYYDVDAQIKIDEDGRVVDVETKGTPNPGVGICMRMALRDMRLPEGFFEAGLLRTSSAANGQAMPDRGQIGEVVIITVVTIVFTEVIIETFAIAIGVTVTATVAAGVADAAARKKKRKKEPTCVDHYEGCMDDAGIADRLGNHWKSSLCNACRLKCKNNQWPDSVPLGSRIESCKYEGIDKWNN